MPPVQGTALLPGRHVRLCGRVGGGAAPSACLSRGRCARRPNSNPNPTRRHISLRFWISPISPLHLPYISRCPCSRTGTSRCASGCSRSRAPSPAASTVPPTLSLSLIALTLTLSLILTLTLSLTLTLTLTLTLFLSRTRPRALALTLARHGGLRPTVSPTALLQLGVCGCGAHGQRGELRLRPQRAGRVDASRPNASLGQDDEGHDLEPRPTAPPRTLCRRGRRGATDSGAPLPPPGPNLPTTGRRQRHSRRQLAAHAAGKRHRCGPPPQLARIPPHLARSRSELATSPELPTHGPL